MSRRPFIAGNWKLNKGPADADALARELDTAELGQPQIAALAHDLAAQLAAVDVVQRAVRRLLEA